MRIRAESFGIVASLAILIATGCGEDVKRASRRGTGPAKDTAAEKQDDEAEGPEKLVLTDEDFIESERNRDPFRSYATAFRARPLDEMQRSVIMPSTTVEEMNLIAIVTGVPRPKAMLVDPMGVGHVVKRGDYVGRPKVLQATGSVAMMLNWRVERIRDNEVVLTQQDPTDPTQTALTKVLTLREEVAATR